MSSKDDIAKMREEREALITWRTYSRHVVADMVEACAVCGAIRDKERLTRCRWCEDSYVCKEGLCGQKHHLDVHPSIAFWTW